MAKKRRKKGKVERELDTIDISLNSILGQYPQINPKERKKKEIEKKKMNGRYEMKALSMICNERTA